MTLQKGDFLLINYNAKVKETNEVFDTTNDDVAKKEHLKKEGEIYEPKLVVIGEGWLLKPLDEALTTMEVDKPATVEISADKGFGARDPEKIKRVHLRQLLEKQINPTIGARIEFQGKMATVRSIGAGRVLLDFNPPLAGRTLIYDVTPLKKLATKEEKIVALIHRRITPVEENKFKVTITGQTLDIDMPEDTFYVEGVQIAKRGIALDIQKFITDIAEIKFIETFKSEPKPAPAAAAPAAAPVPEAKSAAAAEPAPAAKPKSKPKAKAKAAEQ
jgi:peptidylprolyl isomerase